MELNAFITLFCGIALLAAKPGPGVMTVATKAMGEGIMPVIYFMVGTNLVKIIFFTLVILGYSVMPENALVVAIVLKTLTALYLIWMGVQGIKKLDPEAEPHERLLK
jgi:threonine/homoserine/homoserine lactone efflux protein